VYTGWAASFVPAWCLSADRFNPFCQTRRPGSAEGLGLWWGSRSAATHKEPDPEDMDRIREPTKFSRVFNTPTLGMRADVAIDAKQECR